VLGQWSPWRSVAICQECSAAHPFPIDILDEYGVYLPTASSAARERVVMFTQQIIGISRKRKAFISGGTRLGPMVRQLSMPVCERCGRLHDNWNIGDYGAYCQRCDDELHAETLFKMRKIFAGDDVETIMDRIYISHRGLFERGVLPGYWFKLMLKDVQRLG
jgi:hypothetical protein